MLDFVEQLLGLMERDLLQQHGALGDALRHAFAFTVGGLVLLVLLDVPIAGAIITAPFFGPAAHVGPTALQLLRNLLERTALGEVAIVGEGVESFVRLAGEPIPWFGLQLRITIQSRARVD